MEAFLLNTVPPHNVGPYAAARGAGHGKFVCDPGTLDENNPGGANDHNNTVMAPHNAHNAPPSPPANTEEQQGSFSLPHQPCMGTSQLPHGARGEGEGGGDDVGEDGVAPAPPHHTHTNHTPTLNDGQERGVMMAEGGGAHGAVGKDGNSEKEEVVVEADENKGMEGLALWLHQVAMTRKSALLEICSDA